MWLYGQEPIKVSHHPAKFGNHKHSGSGDVFSLSCDLAGPCDQRVMRFYGWEPLIGHHPAKFDDYSRCGGGYMYLVVEGQDSTCSRLKRTWRVALLSVILVIFFLGNEWWNIGERNFASLLLKRVEKERQKKKDYSKAFYVKRKRKKVSEMTI